MKASVMRTLLVILISLASCKKDEDTEIDTAKVENFIFGMYQPFCPDNCSEFYLLENGKIYRDSLYRDRQYPL